MDANERIIYDNDACAYDFDEARRNCAEALGESPDEVSDTAVWDYIADETRIQYEAEKMNLDKPLDGRILCYGSLGLWWGRPTGYRIIEDRNLNAVLDQACRDSYTYRVYFDGEDIRAADGHHDGTNRYTFREIREDISDDALDDFLDRLASGQVSDADMERVTRSLAPRVCEIYGWEMARKELAA